MSFHLTSQNVYVDGTILYGSLADVDGNWRDASLDLNTVLGNNNGAFQWGGSDFAGSAHDISFNFEGDDGVPVLRATLVSGDGENWAADVNLAERIHNNDGSFYFEGGESHESHHHGGHHHGHHGHHAGHFGEHEEGSGSDSGSSSDEEEAEPEPEPEPEEESGSSSSSEEEEEEEE